MKKDMKQAVLAILDDNRLLTLATQREDGYPEASLTSFAHDGLLIYIFAPRSGTKVANILRDPHVSAAAGHDTNKPLELKALSLSGTAHIVDDSGEYDHAHQLFQARFPEYRILPRPNPAEVALIRITPHDLTLLDHARGFGHVDSARVRAHDLDEEFEARRRHWTKTQVA